MHLRVFPRFAVAVCLAAPGAMAQIHPYFGLELGTPITDTLNSSSSSGESFLGSVTSTSLFVYHSDTKRLLAGPTFRVEFAHGIGLEFDALYQRINYDFTDSNSSQGSFNYTFQQTTANKWEFPLLVQYEFHLWKAKPFVEAGPSILHITQIKSNIYSANSLASPSSSSLPASSGNWAGFATGGGLDFHTGRFHIRPEVRYSRWFSPTSGPIIAFVSLASFVEADAAPQSVHLNQNEATFLLGITF